MERTPEQRRRIRDVATIIDTNPERYYQQFIASVPADIVEMTETIAGMSEHWCRTAFCIAGWNHVLRHFDVDGYIYIQREVGYEDGEWVPASFDSQRTLEIIEQAAQDFGLGDREGELFYDVWRPVEGLTVGDALRKIADGAHVSEVTAVWVDEDTDDE